MSNNFKKLAVVSMIGITLLMVLSLSSQIEVYMNLRQEKVLVDEQLLSLENDIKLLNQELELIDTKEYIEKIAREKLGYVKANEFVFRETK